MNVQLQLPVSIVSGWVQRGQQEAIEYLQEENRVLREQLGERHLRETVREFTEHYHAERNHQGLENPIFEQPRDPPPFDGVVARRERLGGVLDFYYRSAA